MRLAALDVPALGHKVADLVRRDSEFALGANVQGGGRQRVMAAPHSFFGLALASLGYGHDRLSRKQPVPRLLGRSSKRDTIIAKVGGDSSPYSAG